MQIICFRSNSNLVTDMPKTKLQMLHNRLARVILYADIRTPVNMVNDMLHDLQWLNLTSPTSRTLVFISLMNHPFFRP